MTRRLLAGGMTALLVTGLLAGCTSKRAPKVSPRPSSAAGSIAPDVQVVQVRADDAMRFTPASIRVRRGRVRIVFAVSGKVPHTFTSPALHADSGNVPPGQEKSIDLIVPRSGSYPFWCLYQKAQGMTGTIVVS